MADDFDPRALTDDELRSILDDQMSSAGRGREPFSIRPLQPEPDPNRGLSRETAASVAAEEPSNPVIGLGRRLDKIKRGGTQGFLKLREAMAPEDPAIKDAIAGFDAEGRENDLAYGAYARENPAAAGFGESLPTLPMGGGLLSLPAKASIPGLVSEGNVEDRLMLGGIDAVSAGVGNSLGRVAGGYVNPNLSRVQRDTLTQGRARGIYPRLSQVTKNRDLEGMEDWSGRMMAGRHVMGSFEDANARGFNSIAAESMGQRADAAGQLGPEVFAQAKRDMQDIFQQVDRLPDVPPTATPMSSPRVYDGIPRPSGRTGGPPIVLGPDVANAAMEVLRQQSMQLTPDPVLTRIANEAMGASQNGWRMTGESYQALHHELTNASHNAFNAGDPKSGRAFAALRDAIDQAADTSLRNIGRGDLADQLQTVRQQYANFKTLETGRVAEGGNVSPPRVAQALRTNNPDAFRTGRNTGQPLDFIARWAELFPQLRAGSQTAERNAMSDVATGTINLATLGIPAATVAKTTTSPWITGFPARYGGTAAGQAAETVIDPTISGSVQSFMRRILRPQTP